MATNGDFSTTSSYKNSDPEPPRKRRRGMARLLSDVSNLVDVDGRRRETDCMERKSKVAAQERVKVLVTPQRPRGDSELGNQVKYSESIEESSDPTSTEDKPLNIRMFLRHNPSIIEKGSTLLDDYLERNMPTELHRGVALKVFNVALTSWRCTVMEAYQKASEVSDVSVRTIERWVSDYYITLIELNIDEIEDEDLDVVLSSNRGKSSKNPLSLIKNDEFCTNARKYVKENACKKGEPNLTCDDFCKWVGNTYSCQIGKETARRWLHTLGFKQVNHHKGVYFDGHERDDVVEYRAKFVETLGNLDRRFDFDEHVPNLREGEKPLVLIHHDESTFYANADQSYYWSDGSSAYSQTKKPRAVHYGE